MELVLAPSALYDVILLANTVSKWIPLNTEGNWPRAVLPTLHSSPPGHDWTYSFWHQVDFLVSTRPLLPIMVLGTNHSHQLSLSEAPGTTHFLWGWENAQAGKVPCLIRAQWHSTLVKIRTCGLIVSQVECCSHWVWPLQEVTCGMPPMGISLSYMECLSWLTHGLPV